MSLTARPVWLSDINTVSGGAEKPRAAAPTAAPTAADTEAGAITAAETRMTQEAEETDTWSAQDTEAAADTRSTQDTEEDAVTLLAPAPTPAPARTTQTVARRTRQVSRRRLKAAVDPTETADTR